MNTSSVELPRALDLLITKTELIVTLADSRKLSVPIAWFPKLKQATEKQRNEWRWIGKGQGIHWPKLDEDLSIAGFLKGHGTIKKNSRSRVVRGKNSRTLSAES